MAIAISAIFAEICMAIMLHFNCVSQASKYIISSSVTFLCSVQCKSTTMRIIVTTIDLCIDYSSALIVIITKT